MNRFIFTKISISHSEKNQLILNPFLFQRWRFSEAFKPVQSWCFQKNCIEAVGNHLKVCEFNQREQQNAHELLLKQVVDVRESEGFSTKEVLQRKRNSRKVSQMSLQVSQFYWD